MAAAIFGVWGDRMKEVCSPEASLDEWGEDPHGSKRVNDRYFEASVIPEIIWTLTPTRPGWRSKLETMMSVAIVTIFIMTHGHRGKLASKK